MSRSGALRSTAAALVCSAAPTLALAAAEANGGAEHHEPGVSSLGWYVVNFVLLIGLLVWKGRAPITRFLGDRKENALSELRAAERARDEAHAKLAEYESRLTRIEAEVTTILADTLKLAESERDRILREAAQAAERIRTQASLMVEQEVRRARAELAREVTDSAAREATRILESGFTSDDQERLVREFVTKEEALS